MNSPATADHPPILVLGAYGLLGCSLSAALTESGYHVVRQGRREAAEVRCDPSDPASMRALLARVAPHAVVNLIAATDVDACERNVEAAFLGNVRPVEALTRELAAIGPRTHLVHISTDQVYSGPGPHPESDALPCNVYGVTKYAAEVVAERAGATVLRANFFGRSRCPDRTSLSDWLVASLRARRPITVFADVLFSPVHLSTLCARIAAAIRARTPGVYNVGSTGGMSKAEFAFEVARVLELDCSHVTVGPSTHLPGRARRPSDMRMDTTLFTTKFGAPAPQMRREIELLRKEYDRA